MSDIKRAVAAGLQAVNEQLEGADRVRVVVLVATEGLDGEDSGFGADGFDDPADMRDSVLKHARTIASAVNEAHARQPGSPSRTPSRH